MAYATVHHYKCLVQSTSISGGQPRRPYLLGGLDVLLTLTPGLISDLRELGIRVLPSPAAAGLLVALDAAGLLIGDGGVTVAVARHASMVLDDGIGTPSATLVSLWQSNLSCLRAERLVRFTVRPGASAWASVGGTP